MPAIRTARRFMIRHRLPWCYWGENPHKKPRMGWRDQIREAYLKHFLKSTNGVFGIGKAACTSYQSLLPEGVPVHNLPYAPNLDPLLMPGEETIQIAKRLRAKWPVDDPVVILFSGSLTHRKAPDTLLAAFAQVASSHSQICLQFVGDGPMLVQLKAEVERLEIADRVRFLGFRGGRELHAAYVSADLFVLPTRTHEGWGVVVQEALAAGLPVLLSSRVGSLADVMSAGAAAREFPPNDANSLASLLAEVAGNNSTRERMSGSARTTARSLDCHAATSLFSDLVVKLGPSRHPEHAVRQSTL